jgi:hypothetical protein
MRAAAGAVAALCAALMAPSPAGAQPAAEQVVVVGGLRPTRGAAFKKTDIGRLPEAQRLRAIAEGLAGEIAGRSIIDHAGLRTLLGRSYLASFFDCAGGVKCAARVFAPLHPQAGWVMFGDYAVRRGTYSFRLRLVELGSGRLLANTEFSLRARQIEEREQWQRQLTALLAAVAEPGSAPVAETGGTAKPAGAKPGAKPGDAGLAATSGAKPGARPAARPAAGARPAGGQTPAEPATDDSTGDPTDDPTGDPTDETGGPSGEPKRVSSATSADELTDADFGVVADSDATIRTDKADERPDDGPWLQAATVAGAVSRYFDFQNAPDNEVLRPDGYNSGWTARLGGSIELYPLVFAQRGGPRLQRIGIQSEYSRTDIAAGGRETELYVGATYRIPVGRSPLYPTFKIAAGYLRHDFVIIDEDVDFPSVSYRGGVVGADVHFPLFTPRIALNASAHTMFLLPYGEIFQEQQYGDSRVGGLDLGASLEIRPFSVLFFRIGARYSRFSLEFDGDGDLSSDGAVGAQDRNLAGSVVTGVYL